MSSPVALIKCFSYDQPVLDQSVRQTIDLIGGINQFVKHGQRVLLKINLLSAQTPEKAITTHPAIVRSIIRLVKSVGAYPVIGDSPSGTFKGIEHHWIKTGIKEIADEEGVELVTFETQPIVKFQLPGRKYVSTLHISKPVLDADVIISLPKLKTHSLLLYTGAIKNMFGCVPGLLKSEYHKQAPHPDDLAQMLVDLYAIIKPELTIMDGIVGMEGNGPSRGQPRAIGALLASIDGVALDTIASTILGYNPQDIATTRIAARQGLGENRLTNIKITGGRLEDFIQQNTLLPSNALLRKIPRGLLRWVLEKFLWAKPVSDKALCTQCAMCIKSCPVQAMKMGKLVPEIDESICINCLCCHELCPVGAIDIKTSWLLSAFTGHRHKEPK
jgi:uncharacterized protein (DUF362 family)/Pyruvate/2-oxoacid:ferredoxin oxidoreductase delta subunit